jgi:peroxiredoxin
MKKSIFILLISLSFGAILSSFTLESNDPIKLAGLEIGDKAPDFKLKSTSGEMVSLSGIQAKGYIVIFTCNHCPWAIKYEDRMIALHQKYEKMGYPVIAINPNDPSVQPEDSFEKMVERAKEKSFPFHYLFDDGQKVFPAYGATRTPHVFLLDESMTVKYIGAIDDNADDASKVESTYLENAIMALKDNKNPDPATTKAVGCTIKVKKS